jgi:hypothetical protein
VPKIVEQPNPEPTATKSNHRHRWKASRTNRPPVLAIHRDFRLDGWRNHGEDNHVNKQVLHSSLVMSDDPAHLPLLPMALNKGNMDGW